MSVSIRHACEDDLNSILDIVNYEVRNTTSIYHYKEQTLPQQRDWFFKKMQHNYPVLVAELNNKIIGFATYGTFREKIGYQFTVEHSVYVHHKHRGLGAGHMLMQNLITLATQNNYHTMIAGIDTANTSSISFHKKFGFVEVGLIKEVAFKFNQWLDLCFMQLLLPSKHD